MLSCWSLLLSHLSVILFEVASVIIVAIRNCRKLQKKLPPLRARHQKLSGRQFSRYRIVSCQLSYKDSVGLRKHVAYTTSALQHQRF
uniref:Putative secreted protein n=1 Tax=Ixodes ricinus TaxID=34613 RepID=A0A6B0UA04_IXORI